MFQSLLPSFDDFLNRYMESSSMWADPADKARREKAQGVPSPADFHEFLQIRQALEPMIVELVMPRASRKQLAELNAIVARQEQLSGNAHAGPVVMELDRRFHLYLAELAGNRLLMAIMRSIWTLQEQAPSDPFQKSENVEVLHRQHTEIVEAIRNADCARAKDAVLRHITCAYDVFACGPSEASAKIGTA